MTTWDDDTLVSLTFLESSRARTFQAALTACSVQMDESPLACVTVDIYTAEGESDDDPRLIHPVTLTFHIQARKVEELGGIAALFQTYAMGGLTLEVREDVDDEWRHLPFAFNPNDDGSLSLEAKLLRFSDFAVFVDACVLEESKRLMGAARHVPTSTATATPKPTATPEPTATPTPTAAPEPTPPAELPPAGGSPPPASLPLALVLAGALFTLAAVRILIARTRGQREEPMR